MGLHSWEVGIVVAFTGEKNRKTSENQLIAQIDSPRSLSKTFHGLPTAKKRRSIVTQHLPRVCIMLTYQADCFHCRPSHLPCNIYIYITLWKEPFCIMRTFNFILMMIFQYFYRTVTIFIYFYIMVLKLQIETRRTTRGYSSTVYCYIILCMKTFDRLPLWGGSGGSEPELFSGSRCIRRQRDTEDSCGSAVCANLSWRLFRFQSKVGTTFMEMFNYKSCVSLRLTFERL